MTSTQAIPPAASPQPAFCQTFELRRSTASQPFEPGYTQRIAVKVIDFRGNEVVRVVGLDA